MCRIIKLFSPEDKKVYTWHNQPFNAYRSHTLIMGCDERDTFRFFGTIDGIVVTDQSITVYYTNGWYFRVTNH